MRKRTMILCACAMAICLVWGTALAQDPAVDIYLNRSSGSIGQDTVELWVEADNYGPTINVDVHFAIVAPNGTIYEIPSWHTDFTPLFSNLALPGDFTFGPAILGVYSVGDFPLNTVGDYLFAAAFTEPWTLNFIGDISFASFRVTDQGASEGSYGQLSINLDKSYDSYYAHAWETTVSAGGSFIEVFEAAKRSALTAEEGCEVKTMDWENGGETGDMRWLDAGEKIDMQGSPLGNVQLDRYSMMNLIAYMPGIDMEEGHYGGGSTYTFVGYGGPDVGSFSVSIVAPDALDLYEPQLEDTPVINRSHDLDVRWNGAGHGQVYVDITTYDIDEQTMMPKSITWCTCIFDDDGEGQIPASILSQLPASSASAGFWLPNFLIQRFNTAEFSADGLSLGGAAHATTSVGGDVELQ